MLPPRSVLFLTLACGSSTAISYGCYRILPPNAEAGISSSEPRNSGEEPGAPQPNRENLGNGDGADSAVGGSPSSTDSIQLNSAGNQAPSTGGPNPSIPQEGAGQETGTPSGTNPGTDTQ